MEVININKLLNVTTNQKTTSGLILDEECGKLGIWDYSVVIKQCYVSTLSLIVLIPTFLIVVYYF